MKAACMSKYSCLAWTLTKSLTRISNIFSPLIPWEDPYYCKLIPAAEHKSFWRLEIIIQSFELNILFVCCSAVHIRSLRENYLKLICGCCVQKISCCLFRETARLCCRHVFLFCQQHCSFFTFIISTQPDWLLCSLCLEGDYKDKGRSYVIEACLSRLSKCTYGGEWE